MNAINTSMSGYPLFLSNLMADIGFDRCRQA